MNRSLWDRITTSKGLMISIGAHLLFGAIAAYWVVQTIQTKRKMTFAGGPPAINASKRALDHKVSLGKKKAVMSAPAQAKRIMSTGLTKVALPDLPSLPSATDAVPNRMGGIGGVGTSFGSGGGGSGLGGGGGSGINFFGLRSMIRSVVFVVDISNSMVRGQKNVRTYEALEKEVARVVTALDPMAKFGLVAFAADVSAYRDGLAPAAMHEKRRALEWMKKQSPAEILNPKLSEKAREEVEHKHRGTRVDLGLKRAFAMQPDVIFVVSDGDPTGENPDSVLKFVEAEQKKLPRPAKIHVIGYVPEAGEEAFMQSLARANGGEYRRVNLNEVAK
jgi:hypothetical protein